MIFRVSELALFGSMLLERSFWEEKLESLLRIHPRFFEAVCNHVRRHWEIDQTCRFQLIDRIISWQYQTAHVGQA